MSRDDLSVPGQRESSADDIMMVYMGCGLTMKSKSGDFALR